MTFAISMPSLIVLGFIVVSNVKLMMMFVYPQSTQPSYFDEFIETSDPTDAEFLADIPDDIPTELALRVRRAIALSAWLEVDEIWPETTMAELQETCSHKSEPS